MSPRRIALVTTSRADWGIYRPLARRLAADPAIELRVVAAGMHLAAEFGDTRSEIVADGFAPAADVEALDPSDTPAGTARAMGRATEGFAAAFADLRPEIVLVLGDRFEMHAAAVAARPFPLALAHLHGGELSLGVLDDAWRHSITKLAHLHFVACAEYGRRVRQMGEEDWRVTVSGAPGLDNLAAIEPMATSELADKFELALDPAPLLVTFHPTGDDGAEADALFHALDGAGRPVVFTAPNADAGGRRLLQAIRERVAARPGWRLVEHLGTRGYFGLMAAAAAMVGNSSSGIIEAASFRLPVVNIGDRQEGRLRPANVIDAAAEPDAVSAALALALSPTFRASLAGLVNPFQGERPAAEAIHGVLAGVALDSRLFKKRFVDR